jgi:hypothetical protein
MEKNPVSGFGMNIPDYFPRAQKQFSGLKILKFCDADPDTGSFLPWILDPWWKNAFPG